MKTAERMPAGRLLRTLRARLAPHLVPSDWRGGAGSLLVAWVTCMIFMPIAQWIVGEPSLIAGVVVSVLLQGSLSVLLLARLGGWRRAAATSAAAILLGWGAEALGWHTGFPFGAYHYTAKLQPQLAGVPVLIPLAWLMMLPPAWAVARRLTGRGSGPLFVAASALAFTAWDLYLDPQMVSWGLWAWDQPGHYFGIPLVNFAGWLLVSALITAVARPPALPTRPLLVVYTVTWLIEAVGLALFWGLHGAALSGFLGMGLFVVLAWRRPAD